MPVIKIADVQVRIDFIYPDYFEHNIEHYLSNNEVYIHHIKTSLTDIIEAYLEPALKIIKNKKIYKHNENTIIDVTQDDHVLYRVIHDQSYSRCELILSALAIDKPSIEYVVSGVFISEILARHQRYVLHGAAIEYLGFGYVLSGPSGIGKTTLSKLLLQNEKDMILINDDKAVIYLADGEFKIASLPWSGINHININKVIPLKNITFLQHSKSNTFIEIAEIEKQKLLLKNIAKPSDKKVVDSLLDFMSLLTKNIDISVYQFTKNIITGNTF